MPEITRETRLTNREKEVLLWTARGKTAWETAVILNISRTTVLSHLKNARIKLDTTNVAQTIAEAIRRSEIPS
ncbi:helix-turn-helix domain-containing protein [Agrobacterium pusense]|uniref:Helix-turn-helix transcriptional regulator n=1 Tax=Agrobacterium pusense TaxID=648995 RepID=A0A6H0ZW20_9HYPH|nr:helix-turn-helix domain-containing protein [Agrobacterium pusense]PZP76028.1 MAG: helix-turn-helix transcriptional regulator [Delftia acidovorans]QIX24041.1 helix-turn-helix transcriptional regulator [Agrobacterium pusense]